jgi:acetylornithine deacetylase/succinyl-diaminopimelate desuccinylase-like protein
MPHQCVNALELGVAVALELGRRCAEQAPPHPEERRYGFASPSSFKATVIEAPNRAVSTIPGRVVVEGDLRVTRSTLRTRSRPARGPSGELGRALAAGAAPPGLPSARTADGRAGRLDFTWVGPTTRGWPANLASPALTALEAAIRRRRGAGAVQRTSMTGALPLVSELVRRGMDLAITGFGRGRYYHAPTSRPRSTTSPTASRSSSSWSRGPERCASVAFRGRAGMGYRRDGGGVVVARSPRRRCGAGRGPRGLSLLC